MNPLCNWGFIDASSLLLILLGWYLTNRYIEPRLRGLPLDGDFGEPPGSGPVNPKPAMLQGLTPAERRGLMAGVGAMLAALFLLGTAAWPTGSPLRAKDGGLTTAGAPLMEAIVPLIFLIFLIPSVVYGYAAGTVKSHRDIVQGMSKSMSSARLLPGAGLLRRAVHLCLSGNPTWVPSSLSKVRRSYSGAVPGPVTIVGIIVISVLVDLLVGSASAKWAIIGADLRPHVDAGRAFARADSGRLSHRRFDHQHHHAAHALLSVDRGLMPALREEHGDRNAGGADAAIFAHLPRDLDRAAHRLLDVEHPARAAGELYVSTRVSGGSHLGYILKKYKEYHRGRQFLPIARICQVADSTHN